MPSQRFGNRREAGNVLSSHLLHYAGRSDVLVLALPRGGVPVAYEVAQALRAPLDVFVVRKLGLPWHPELAMGAIALGGVEILNADVVKAYNVPPAVIRGVAAQEEQELARRVAFYRGDRPAKEIAGRIVILVDDGLATGSTMKAAIAAVRRQRPQRVVVAVPVAPHESCIEVGAVADEMVCAHTPPDFSAVGAWYQDFSQTSDEEVRQLLVEQQAPATFDRE